MLKKQLIFFLIATLFLSVFQKMLKTGEMLKKI